MVTLYEILQALQNALSLLGTLLGISNAIQSQTQKAAQENVPFHIDNTVDLIQGQTSSTNSLVTDPIVGLAAIQAELDSIEAQIAAVQTNILTALGTPQQTGVAVTLPTYPPTTWTDSITNSTAAAVWAYPDTDGSAYGDDLHEAKLILASIGSWYSQRVPGQPYLLLFSQVAWSNLDNNDSFPYPPLDASTILTSDANATAWVSRAYSGYGWIALAMADTEVTCYQDQNVSSMYWVLDLTQQQFEALKPTTSSFNLAPIWPGIDNVTYLDPITMTTGDTVSVVCHGCVIRIFSAPSRIGTFQYGVTTAYRAAGAIAFWNDDGWDEAFQPITFEWQVYVPKTMTEAQGLDYFMIGGFSATLTPFLIN